MAEQTLIFESGERFATMSSTGRVRRWTVDPGGAVYDDHPKPVADPDVVDEVRVSVREILTDVVHDRLVEAVVESVKSHLDEHVRIVADRARRAPGLARLVDINLEPRTGDIARWAAEHPASTAVRLHPEDVTLIFEDADGDTRMSTSLADFRTTERVTSE